MPFCPNCGAAYDSGTACMRCGTALATPIIEVRPSTPSPPAKFRRLLAGGIDVLSCYLITLFLARVAAPRVVLSNRFRGPLLALALLALPALYVLFRDCLGGKSLGKLLLGLTAVRRNSLVPIGARLSFQRNVVLAVVGIPVLGWLLFTIVAIVIGVQIAVGYRVRFGEGIGETLVVDDESVSFLDSERPV